MISSRTAISKAIRQLASLIALVFCCMILPAGCGEPAAQKTTLPTDFGEKLQKEKPELFIEKTGKNKTGTLGGRDKRAVIREESLKSKQQGTN